jgi:hypothetical protein
LSIEFTIFTCFRQNLSEKKEDSPEGIAVVADINPIAALTVAWLFISSRWLLALTEDKKGRALALPF